MQKVVLDTNVLVSAFIQRSYPYFIIYELVFGKKIQLCISPELVSEYHEVLNRSKFSRYPDFLNKAETLLTIIETSALEFHPKVKLNIISDKNDNKLLELVSESKADFLVTGNTNDFTMKKFKKTKIVTPKEYWEEHGLKII
jgi:uncharacterized protein